MIISNIKHDCCHVSDGNNIRLVPINCKHGQARLDELNRMRVFGNAFDDMPLFAAADKIIRDDTERIDIRYAALLKIGEAMGVPPVVGEIPEVAVQEYVDDVMS